MPDLAFGFRKPTTTEGRRFEEAPGSQASPRRHYVPRVPGSPRAPGGPHPQEASAEDINNLGASADAQRLMLGFDKPTLLGLAAPLILPPHHDISPGSIVRIFKRTPHI